MKNFKLSLAVLCSVYLIYTTSVFADCSYWSALKDNLPANLKYDPSVIALSDRLVISGVGSDNKAWAIEYRPSVDDGDGTFQWNGLIDALDGTLTSGTRMTLSGGAVVVSALGTDGYVWQRVRQSARTWGGWQKTGSTLLGAGGPNNATLNGRLYRVRKISSGSYTVEHCIDNPICSPGQVIGCKVCNPDGTWWIDESYRCSGSQACVNGSCVFPSTDYIRINEGWHFSIGDTGQNYVPFGCTYADSASIYYWNSVPYPAMIDHFNATRTDRHFDQVESAGANEVRIWLSLHAFEPNYLQINQANYAVVDEYIALAKKHNLRIIIELLDTMEGRDECGSDPTAAVGCISWMSGKLDHQYTDESVIAGQEFLVRSVAQRYASEPTILAWSLINEPIMDWNINSSFWTNWVHTKYGTETVLHSAWSDYPKTGESWGAIAEPPDTNNAGNTRLFDYQTFREDMAYRWASRLSSAIKSVDSNHLVTIEGIQYDAALAGIGSPSMYSAFNPQKISAALDYITLHSYVWDNLIGAGTRPDYGEFTNAHLKYSYTGKPEVVGEFFYNDKVVNDTLGSASGWSAYQCFGNDPRTLVFMQWGTGDTPGALNPAGEKYIKEAASVKNTHLTRAADRSVYQLDLKQAVTSVSDTSSYLAYTQMSRTNGPTAFQFTPDTAPKGFFDYADCQTAGGWACDADIYTQPLQVHFWADAPGSASNFFVGLTIANVTREPAVGNECGGNSVHGFTFTIPANLKDGRPHNISAYAIDVPVGNNPLLGKKTIICTTTTTTSTTSTTKITSTTTTTTTKVSTTSSTTSTTSSSTTSTLFNTSTTTTTILTTTTISSTTTTRAGTCVMPGNYPPCGDVSLSEVVEAINHWAAGSLDLENVIDLINSWADPSGHPPE